MRLLDCLNQLPDDLRMVDLTEIGRKVLTVEELRNKYANRNEDGYEVRKYKRVRGRSITYSIGVVGGHNVFNETTQ